MTARTKRLVKEVTAETMDGANALERELNAYLTKSFIGSTGLPSDECLYLANYIVFWWPKQNHLNHLAERLQNQFGKRNSDPVPRCIDAARGIVEMLKKYEDE